MQNDPTSWNSQSERTKKSILEARPSRNQVVPVGDAEERSQEISCPEKESNRELLYNLLARALFGGYLSSNQIELFEKSIHRQRAIIVLDSHCISIG